MYTNGRTAPRQCGARAVVAARRRPRARPDAEQPWVDVQEWRRGPAGLCRGSAAPHARPRPRIHSAGLSQPRQAHRAPGSGSRACRRPPQRQARDCRQADEAPRCRPDLRCGSTARPARSCATIAAHAGPSSYRCGWPVTAQQPQTPPSALNLRTNTPK